MKYTHPTELANHLCFLSMIDGSFTDEYGSTAASEFAEAAASLEHFAQQTPHDEVKQALRQCIANLNAALEHLESEQSAAGSQLVLETESLFKRCLPYIDAAGPSE